MDHLFTNWFRASASYIHQKTFEVDYPANIFPNAGTPGTRPFAATGKSTPPAANATITPNSTTVITARWGFNRFYSKSTPESRGLRSGFSGVARIVDRGTPNPAFPAITMGGAVNGCATATTGDYTGFGGGITNQDVFYSRSFNATVSKFLGRHTVKAGFDFRTVHDSGTPAAGPTSLGFTSVFTQASPTVSNGLSGSSLATLLLGYPTSGQQTVVAASTISSGITAVLSRTISASHPN